MKYHIKNALSLLVIVYSTCVYSQTNLICNPSFEEIDQEAFDKLNDAEHWHATHFYRWNDPHPNAPSLFNCWMRDDDHTQISSGDATGGVVYGIIPGLFPVTGGSSTNFYGNGPNDPFEETDSSITRVFVESNGESGLTLSSNQLGLQGLDLSPPNTKFGENVFATHGNNYVAMFDFENDEWDAVPSLFTELKWPLQKDVKYTFSMDFCQMNLLGYLKDLEGWEATKEGKIEVWISYDEAPVSPRQKICEIMADDNAWDVTTWDFEAERSYTHLLIEFDPIKGQLFAPMNPKIAGVFIDNLKLYESCETNENQCENARYKRDMLDVSAEEATLSSPGANGTFTTCRVYKIDNANYFEAHIRSEDGSQTYRQFKTDYPGTEWYWDGKDDNGVPMPDDRYAVHLIYAYNDCYHHSDALIKEFDLDRDYSVFDVTSTMNDEGNSVIHGLSNVHHAEVEIYSLTGQLLHTFSLENPPASIALSVASIIEYGDGGNLSLSPGDYGIHIKVSNNCVETEFNLNTRHIGTIPDNGANVMYDWSPVPKPAVFACPFESDYKQNVYSPMNCCEGYLHLENMDIWNSWGEVNIQDSILIGPNVVFEPGAANTLNSGGQILLIPDSSGVVLNGTTVLKPSTFNCEICKIYVYEGGEQYEGDAEDFAGEVTIYQRDSSDNKVMVVFPNPAKGDQEITLLAGTTAIDPQNYKLVLSDPFGKPIQVKMIAERNELLKFKPVNSLSPGSYYLYYESNGEITTFNLVIR